MFNPSQQLLKKGWTYNPGRMSRGKKNAAWHPKMYPDQLRPYLFLDFEHPRKRPDSWNEFEFERLGYVEWPKQVGFFNVGDNFELTPEMMFRLFKKNHTEDFWKPEDNERAVIHLMPLASRNPKETVPKIEEIFAAHVERFGVDHLIYNAVLQAIAFTRDWNRCEEIFKEMQQQNLVPNAQTYVNMMLGAKLHFMNNNKSGDDGEKLAKEKASFYFNEAVRTEQLPAVMRLDTEFNMWWQQLERFGSFDQQQQQEGEQGGFLSKINDRVENEGAKSRPGDMWQIWGWDSRMERKFISREEAVSREAAISGGGKKPSAVGTVFNSYKREPWHRYKGMLRHDFLGPSPKARRDHFSDAPKLFASQQGK